MRTGIIVIIAFLAVHSAPALAQLTQVRSAPARTAVVTGQDQTLNVTWVIGTAPTHTTGALSAFGEFVNASTGASLNDGNRVTIGAPTGTGPLTFLETVTISAAQVAAWRSQGVRLVGYRRAFQPAGGLPVTGQWLIDLRAAGLEGAREAPGGELRVQRIDLDFSTGARIAMVDRGASLAARVAIAYSGTGTLRARWEIADPASQGQPMYRLLSLVREPLGGGQVANLTYSALPTQMSGRYSLRFCIEADNAPGAQCSDTATTVQAIYQVLPGESVAIIRGVSPDSQDLSASEPFRWPAFGGTTTYQLQVFSPATIPDSDPVFVTGLLLPGAVSSAPLSEITRRKLVPGQRYLWRVTAHDIDGRLIARSELAPFVFRP
jgi:hypothetical protein